jgi:hypothetical protein
MWCRVYFRHPEFGPDFDSFACHFESHVCGIPGWALMWGGDQLGTKRYARW